MRYVIAFALLALAVVAFRHAVRTSYDLVDLLWIPAIHLLVLGSIFYATMERSHGK